jgi:hypothetical protein
VNKGKKGRALPKYSPVRIVLYGSTSLGGIDP